MKIEDLPRPANYRRQMAKNGGYEMVPAYTAEEVLGIVENTKPEAVGEIVGFQRVGFRDVPTIYWEEGFNPVIGFKLYAAAPTIEATIKKGQV